MSDTNDETKPKEAEGVPLSQLVLPRSYKCEECRDTGYYGDNGPGIKGNTEYSECECHQSLKTDDEKWRDHFIYPITLEMKKRGISELNIKMTENGKAQFELIPENAEGQSLRPMSADKT